MWKDDFHKPYRNVCCCCELCPPLREEEEERSCTSASQSPKPDLRNERQWSPTWMAAVCLKALVAWLWEFVARPGAVPLHRATALCGRVCGSACQEIIFRCCRLILQHAVDLRLHLIAGVLSSVPKMFTLFA